MSNAPSVASFIRWTNASRVIESLWECATGQIFPMLAGVQDPCSIATGRARLNRSFVEEGEVTAIPVLSAEQLTPVVRRVLDAPDARPLAWSCEPLDVELINPVTAGLYRVVGTAEAGAGAELPWRVILKVIQPSRPHGDTAGDRVRRAAGGLELLAA